MTGKYGKALSKTKQTSIIFSTFAPHLEAIPNAGSFIVNPGEQFSGY